MWLKYISNVRAENSSPRLIEVDYALVMPACKNIVMNLSSLVSLIHLNLVRQFRVTFHPAHLQYLHLITLITWIRTRFLLNQVVMTLL